MITLDWDRITYTEAARRLRYIMGKSTVESIELRTSPSIGGFHVYIEYFNESGITKTWSDRNDWKDDGRRVVGDFLAPREIYRNVMFVYKSSPLGRMYEQPIVKYYRNMYDFEWKCQLLIKPQSQMWLPDLPSCLELQSLLSIQKEQTLA